MALTVLTLLVVFTLCAAQDKHGQMPTLTAGRQFERELSGGETHSYKIEIKSGEFLHAVVDQRGIDVVVALIGPDGKKLVEVDSPNGAQGEEPLFWIADVTGEYQLEVRSLEKEAAPGRYEAKVAVVRASTEIDKKRVAAQRAFIEATNLIRQQTSEAMQKALEKYKETLPQWQEAGEAERLIRTLNGIGRTHYALGEKQQALEYLKQALPLLRALGDRQEEATTLLGIGNIYRGLDENQKALEYYNQALPIMRSVGDRRAEATTLNNIGFVYDSLGEKQKALGYYDQALPILKAVGDRGVEARTTNNVGLVYFSLGEMQKALEYFNQALTILRAVADHVGEATTLNNIGSVYDLLGEKQKALDYYKQALPIARTVGDRGVEAKAVNNVGLVYASLGEMQKALEYFNQALTIMRALTDRGGEATTLNNIGSIYDSLGEKQKALEYYNQVLPIVRAVGDRGGEARTLNNIAGLYSSLGEKQKALEYYNQVLPIVRAVGERRVEAATLTGIGAVYDSLGEKQKALEYYTQALPIIKAVGDPRGEATILSGVGAVYDSLGEKQKALEYYTQALPLMRAAGDRRSEAATLNNIGLVYDSLGEKQKALEYYSQALPILRVVGDRRGAATALNNIGFVYYSLGQKQKSLEHLNEALPVARAVGDRGGEATTLNNMGLVYDSLGEKQRALEHFNQALPILRAVGDRRGEATTLNNIGYAHYSLGEKQKALEYYNQALPIARAVGDRGAEARTLNNLGLVYDSLGEKQQALSYYTQALSIARAVGDRSSEGTMLSNLMFLWKTSNQRLAVFYGKQAINTLQQLRSNISGLEKTIQQTFLRSREDTYRLLADILISEGRLPEAQQVLSLLKEEEYFEFVRRDGNEASSLNGSAELTPEEAAQEKRYREIAEHLTSIGAEYGRLRQKQTRTTEEDQRLTRLETDLTVANQVFQKFLDELEKTFSVSGSESEKAFQLRESQGLMETLRELGSGTVALYTVVGEDKYRVILVTAEVQKAYDNPIKAGELNRKVLEFRELIQNPRLDPRPLGQELYKILIGSELAKDLDQAKAQTLMWSLDGVLRYLPVAALHDGQKYLVERYRNVVFTPASQSRLKDPVSAKWKALGFGVSRAHAGFNPLPGVTEELRGIIRDALRAGDKSEGVLPGTVLLDEAFTASALRNALRQRYPLVHIASHFSFKPGNETDSFLLLGDGSHLTLAQIKALPNVFSGVDLLTLSACDTATGSGASGKEVEGFGVLAQRQGAKAVMATLWPVADESTQLLMREFYRLREANPKWTKVEALQQAQLELLTGKVSSALDTKNKRAEIAGAATSITATNQPRFTPDPKAPYAHPYYWAPFILIGNWK
ncbi:MAG: tetratricopeptide repeat protein [Pyrinomonadaceae bacterium]